MPALMVTAVPFPPDAAPGTAPVPGASSLPKSEIDSRRQASHNPETLYVELWMLPMLFGLEGELTALHQWFRVFLVLRIRDNRDRGFRGPSRE
ncbi:uncharacterized protein LOC105103238 [Camelus dromedarius]|uniref:uncharacterized protein LOC105103238 n=1 Tax=Camelus dromedarius TaxID=9838 RepID=UPI00311A9094